MKNAESTTGPEKSVARPAEDDPARRGFFADSSAAESWSERLSDRFGISLGPDCSRWFDNEIWQQTGAGEFCHPATPAVLMASMPDPIWPPLMPPNFLPIIGNGAGDWLCIRLLDPDASGEVSEGPPSTNGNRAGGNLPSGNPLSGRTDICQWYHGGGDWLPWGNRLAEALLFDWLLPLLPQSRRRHAEPADAAGTQSAEKWEVGTEAWREHPWVRFVFESLPEVRDLDFRSESPSRLGDHLLRHHLCEVPVRCQGMIDALSSDLTLRISPKVANRLGVPWNELMRYCFDLRTLPEELAGRLQSEIGVPVSSCDASQQRWDDVREHAEVLSRTHDDLSWGHDLLAYCRLRDGDSESAGEVFGKAIRCSVFTDQSVRLRTHWATSSGGASKFAAYFLERGDIAAAADGGFEADRLGRVPGSVSHQDLLSMLLGRTGREGRTLRQSYSEMLIDRARDSMATAPATAARLLYAAGWDLGAEPLRGYGQLLDQYIEACAAAGWQGHENLARVHRGCLKARYNL